MKPGDRDPDERFAVRAICFSLAVAFCALASVFAVST